MLPRILEPELMDTAEDAREYDAMDHAVVNECFVSDLLAAWERQRAPLRVAARLEVLDLGTGTALIPIELCRRASNVRVVAVDAAKHMLAVARENVAAAGLAGRIELVLGDAKDLQLGPASFDAVISNSIVHHVARCGDVIAAAVRAAAPGGLQFHRDLCRPKSESQVEHLVATYAGDATPYQQKLLADSLRAALTLEEMRDLVCEFGFAQDTVQMNSDRHWTWVGRYEDLTRSEPELRK